MSMSVFTNTLHAHNWPIFSTDTCDQPYLKLDKPFVEGTNYNDTTYTYILDDPRELEIDPTNHTYFLQFADLIDTLNNIINNKVSNIILTPEDAEYNGNNMSYNITFNGYELINSSIDIFRIKKEQPVQHNYNIKECTYWKIGQFN
ncbi:MAG: hypothetical protein Q8K60_05320 [Parachlamydiaceae bacterium]|nr:hypothetical protein [Parachlamydiaceae bacterium]